MEAWILCETDTHQATGISNARTSRRADRWPSSKEVSKGVPLSTWVDVFPEELLEPDACRLSPALARLFLCPRSCVLWTSRTGDNSQLWDWNVARAMRRRSGATSGTVRVTLPATDESNFSPSRRRRPGPDR